MGYHYCDVLNITCKNCIQRRLPPLYWLLFTGKHEHRKLKIFSGLIYGILLGIGFYYLIIVDLNFTEDAGILVGGTICLFLAFGIAFSSQIRCISSLSMVVLCGKAGRGVLKAIVIAYVLAGPVENIAVNGKEVARVFACTTSLTFNLTKTRFELMFKPFSEALFGMKADVNEVKDTLRSIKDVSAPLTGELEDETEMRKLREENDYLDETLGDTKRSSELDKKYESKGEKIEAERFEKLYLKKIEMRCEDQFTKAANKCRDMFSSAYQKCYDTVTWFAAWILCWPMKLDFVCNIAEALGGASRCDPSKDMDVGFGEGYAYLKESRSSLSKNFKDVRMQYKIGKIKHLKDIRDARDTAKAILHTVTLKKEILDQILKILKRILAFVFLRIIINAQKYHDTYLRDINFDNIYITRYFRKIDARRRAAEKKVLLPLKKIETKKLTDPWSPKPLKSEREQLILQTVKLLLEMITALIFVLLDWLFYEALDLVRRHGRIDYLQTGKHDLRLEIKGTGMIASLLRSVVKGFNIKKRIKIKRSNEMCLPRPSKIPLYYILKIFGMYFVIWILILIQAYTQRLRRVICAYYYRKREKKRVLFLYNETLKRRVGFFKFMKKKVEKNIRLNRLQDGMNACSVLRARYRARCDWLRIFPIARRKCLICQEVEPCRNNESFVPCPNPQCPFVHCLECWNDMGRVCLACVTYETDTSGVEDFDDDIDSD